MVDVELNPAQRSCAQNMDPVKVGRVSELRKAAPSTKHSGPRVIVQSLHSSGARKTRVSTKTSKHTLKVTFYDIRSLDLLIP